jgi:hypothetical protein
MKSNASDNERETIVFISEPHIVYPERRLLGEILQEADLVSRDRVLLAVREQKYYPDLRIGELLALRGWISGKTADFFAECWPVPPERKRERPLGYYLAEAGLLDERQIAEILAEQEKMWLRFGSVAVLKGWLKKTTLNFFLLHLFPEEFARPDRRSKKTDGDSLSCRPTATLPAPSGDTELILPARPTRKPGEDTPRTPKKAPTPNTARRPGPNDDLSDLTDTDDLTGDLGEIRWLH